MSDPPGTLRDVKRYVALDLETVPDEGLVSALDAEPGLPYADKLCRLLARRRAQSGGRSDFLPVPYHRPVVACWLEARDERGALVPEAAGCWTEGSAPEAAFLERTWERVRERTLVTFHGRGFDLPVLELRSLKLGLSAPGFAGGRQAGLAAHHDLFELLSSGGAAPSSLDIYAKLVGLPGKEDVAGKDVASLYAHGQLGRIAGYCMSDVVQTWLLYLRYRLLEGTLQPAAYVRSVGAAREALPGLLSRELEPEARAPLHAFLARCDGFFDELPAFPALEAM